MRTMSHLYPADNQATDEPVMDKVWYVLSVFTLCAAPTYGIGMFLAAASLAVAGLLTSAPFRTPSRD